MGGAGVRRAVAGRCRGRGRNFENRRDGSISLLLVHCGHKAEVNETSQLWKVLPNPIHTSRCSRQSATNMESRDELSLDVYVGASGDWRRIPTPSVFAPSALESAKSGARRCRGDLLRSGVDVMVHQGNCLTTKAHGLSKTVADALPWADVYSERTRAPNARNLAIGAHHGVPGTAEIRVCPYPSRLYRSGKRERPLAVGMLMGQWAPSVPGKYYRNLPGAPRDSADERLRWFVESLTHLDALLSVMRRERHVGHTVGFPWRIGCGLAGGDWAQYLRVIDAWADEQWERHRVRVSLWKLG